MGIVASNARALAGVVEPEAVATALGMLLSGMCAPCAIIPMRGSYKRWRLTLTLAFALRPAGADHLLVRFS